MAKARQTKTDKVHKMLTHPQGASLDKICAATGWQPHSARAALSGLRKAGHAIESTGSDGKHKMSIYRIIPASGPAS